MPDADVFPQLALVPTKSIRFHERPERRRTTRLTERLRSDAFLRNPPIVADMGDGRFLLLDGANRVSAFADLGLSHVPAQIVDYADPTIELRGWHHLLLDPSALDLKTIYGAIKGVELRALSPAALSRALEFREIYAAWVDHQAQAWGLFPKGSWPSLAQRMQVLTDVIACYEHDSPLERIKLASYDELPAVVERQTFELCLFPILTKEELMHLVREEQMIPTGITRHLIPGRVLGLNIEIAFLTNLDSEEEKGAHFRAHLDALELGGRIRYYEEPVFIMNE